MNNKITVYRKGHKMDAYNNWYVLLEMNVSNELFILLHAYDKPEFTLYDLMQVERKEWVKFAKDIKERSTNAKLDKILAAVEGHEYVPEPVSNEMEYPWSDAQELGIKDKWDDHFFYYLDYINDLTELVGFIRGLQMQNLEGGKLFKHSLDNIKIVLNDN